MQDAQGCLSPNSDKKRMPKFLQIGGYTFTVFMV
jgi:hypothetical protein